MPKKLTHSFRVVLFGATGLVGKEALTQLEQNPGIIKIDVIGRNPIESSSSKTKFHFSELDLESLKTILNFPADIALCCLGTTMAKAKSKEAFYHVDHDLVLNSAKACLAAGIPSFGVISSVGARPDGMSYYLRVKSEMERDLSKLRFNRIVILRPSFLLGERSEKRFFENIFKKAAPYLAPFFLGPLRRYRFVSAAAVAHQLITMTSQTQSGVEIVENEDIRITH